MRGLSNLPPGCTDRMIEEQANGPECHRCGDDACQHAEGVGGCYACECEGFEEGGPPERPDPADEDWGEDERDLTEGL